MLVKKLWYLIKHIQFGWFAILSVYTISAFSLLLYQPEVWSDEAVYAAIAREYHQHGRLAVPIWEGLLPGVETRALWNPPFFFWLVSFWLQIVPTTLVYQRLLSVLLGAGTIIIWMLLAGRLIPQLKNRVYLIGLGLSLDFLFMRAARFSRPEILLLFLAGTSLLFFLKSISIQQKSRSILWRSGSILSASLCLLVHPIGIVVLVWNSIALLHFSNQTNRQKIMSLIRMIGLSLLPLIVWLLSLGEDWGIFVAQYTLAINKKALDEFWIFLFTRSDSLLPQIIFGITQALSLYGVYKLLHKKTFLNHFLAWSLILTWLMVIYGRMLWYAVLVIPLTYVVLLKVLELESGIQKRYIQFGLFILISLNSLHWLSDIYTVYGRRLSYPEYLESIRQAVPEGKTVFLSAGPEPYFAFAEANRANKLILFPAIETSVADYLAVLQTVDYVVYTGSYTSEVFGRFLEEYLELNVATYTSVGEESGFLAYVFELKPVDKRRIDHLENHNWDYFRSL